MHILATMNLKNTLLITLLLTGLALSPGSNASDTDPTTSPLPIPGFGSTERAWVFLFKYDAATPAAMVTSVLSYSTSHTQAGFMFMTMVVLNHWKSRLVVLGSSISHSQRLWTW